MKKLISIGSFLALFLNPLVYADSSKKISEVKTNHWIIVSQAVAKDDMGTYFAFQACQYDKRNTESFNCQNIGSPAGYIPEHLKYFRHSGVFLKAAAHLPILPAIALAAFTTVKASTVLTAATGLFVLVATEGAGLTITAKAISVAALAGLTGVGPTLVGNEVLKTNETGIEAAQSSTKFDLQEQKDSPLMLMRLSKNDVDAFADLLDLADNIKNIPYKDEFDGPYTP